MEIGSFLCVTTTDSGATFRSLAQAFSHHTNSTSCASSRVASQVAGPSRDAEVGPKFQQTSSKQSFGLHIRTTSCRFGRDDQASSVAGKRDELSSFHRLLDHCRLATNRALSQIIHVLVDP